MKSFDFTEKEVGLIIDGLFNARNKCTEAINEIRIGEDENGNEFFIDNDGKEMFDEFTAYINNIDALLKKLN